MHPTLYVQNSAPQQPLMSSRWVTQYDEGVALYNLRSSLVIIYRLYIRFNSIFHYSQHLEYKTDVLITRPGVICEREKKKLSVKVLC